MTAPELATELYCPACEAPLDRGSSLQGVDRLHRTRGEFEVVCCSACGTGMTLPFATRAELAAHYPSGYGPYDDSLGVVTRTISRAIRWGQGRRALRSAPLHVLHGRQAGRALDVGCGRGDLAGLLVQRGWQVTGIDPSEDACRAARLRGVDARRGTLGEVELENGAYDAAIFRHSLEHSADSSRDLEKAVRALRPAGLVLITVPNFGSWQRWRFGSYWYHLDLPRHRVHFTARGLGAMLNRAGAEIESLTTSTSTVGLPATAQYRLAGHCLFPSGLPLRIASGLCVVVLPVTWILDRAHGGGDELHAVARRPSRRPFSDRPEAPPSGG